MVTNSSANAGDAGDMGLIPGSGRSPGEGHGNILFSVLAWKIPWTEEPGRMEESDATEHACMAPLVPGI